MVSGVRRKRLRGEQPIDIELIGTFFEGEPFHHHGFPIRYSSCVDAQA
jgi:hypothetical protein